MIRPLPRDTNRAVNEALDGCKNLGLILDKFQPWQPVNQQVNESGWDLFMNSSAEWLRDRPSGSAARGAWFTGRVTRGQLIDRALEPNSRIRKDELSPFIKRWESQATAINARLFLLWTETPLIIGLGAKGTLETALTLHPLYGFPYIPGSALKGLARAAAFFDLAEQLGLAGVDNETFLQGNETPLQRLAKALDEKKEKDWPNYLSQAAAAIRDQAQEFRALFGWRGAAGQVIFLDSIPAVASSAERPLIVPEVMTPHFRAYYDRSRPPDDADSPNPISLLAVAAHTPFGFAIGLRRGQLNGVLRERATYWLRRGLLELGLGGKTASGYGFFVEAKPQPTRVPVKSREPDLTGYNPNSGPGRPSKSGAPPPTPPPPPKSGPSLGDEVLKRWQQGNKEEK